MSDILSVISENSDWLFGSSSVAGLILAGLQIYFGKTLKENKSKPAPKVSKPVPYALAAVAMVWASSGYYFVTGPQGQGQSTVVEGNTIEGGEGSTNVISSGSTVTINN